MNIILISFFIIILNIPFGYWRAAVKKFSVQWVLAVHIPVPFVILFRIYSDIGFALYTYPVLVSAFFLGQFIGSRIYNRRLELGLQPISSCFVMDTYRKFKS